ncbi:uncharacterized protein LOC119078734 [Bradysia coprophila]|uniref:uncharacterized protein LOC119078734 n=1 Tax=Bradysia coprophila TaxID=38358 RepID=UPI00187D8D62|nr:uncharacterized protein LOC119078734 [Bradysia coprophila]
MSIRSRILTVKWLLAIVVILHITSGKTNLEMSRKYTYGESLSDDEQDVETIRCQLKSMCEAYCFQQNKSSAVDGNTLNDTRCATSGYHMTFVFSNVTTLRPGWFVHNALITRITIRDVGSITDIEPGAFEDCTFRYVWSLELRGTAIIYLKKGALAGLNNLKSLSLYANNEMMGIEENALLGLYQLEEFTMEEQKLLSDLTNITETIEWKYLQSLNLSKNSFGLTILAPIFEGCARVRNLILSNSEIEVIGANAFEPMEHTIEILDLSNNQLKHLPNGLLGNMIRPNVKLYLSRNLWDCSCVAKELQEYAINRPYLIVDSPLICETPLSENGNCMENVSIECYSTPYPYEPTTDSLAPDKNLNYLSCSDQSGPNQPSIAVETEFQFFKIKQEGDDKIVVETNYPDSSLALVYVNDHDYHAKCQYNLKRIMEFDSMNPKAGYLFCLMKKSSTATSPRNCLPFHFETKFVWGRDRILVTLVCSFALAIVIGVIIGCLFICRYRRVSRAVSRQDSRYSKGRKVIDEFNAWSAYQHRKFFMHPEYTSNKLRRSVSENSLDSQKTYLTPSPVFDVMQRRSRNSEIRNIVDYSMTNYIDKLPYDIGPPPPLPPCNNKNGRKESIYATIMDPPFDGEYVPYVYLKRKY